jgi:hypothetical protein
MTTERKTPYPSGAVVKEFTVIEALRRLYGDAWVDARLEKGWISPEGKFIGKKVGKYWGLSALHCRRAIRELEEK